MVLFPLLMAILEPEGIPTAPSLLEVRVPPIYSIPVSCSGETAWSTSTVALPLSVPYLTVTVRACAVSFAFTVSLPSAIE